MFCKSYYPSESIKMKSTSPAVLITYLSRYPDFFFKTEKHTHSLIPNRVAFLGVFYYLIHCLLYNTLLKYNTKYKTGKRVKRTFPHKIKLNYLYFRESQNKKGCKIIFFRCFNYLYHWLFNHVRFIFHLKLLLSVNVR